MQRHDVIVIGSGTAGYTAAHACRKAGKSVLVVDKRPFGGTCAMRGCQPKKILVAAVQAVHGANALHGQGVTGESRLDWPSLMRFKRDFTDAVPQGTEQGFLDAGMRTAHGLATFVGPRRLRIGEEEHEAGHIVIAAGAVPRKLKIPGDEVLLDSDVFLELDALPESIAFVGGGFVCFEFAFICALAGVRTTVIHRGDRFLRNFDPDLVALLMEAGKARGIEFLPETNVVAVRRDGRDIVLDLDGSGPTSLRVQSAVAAVGRVPDLDGLGLDVAGVSETPRGISVNAFMQSVSNPAVYAVGDAADAPFALATTADMEAETAATNILQGNTTEADHVAVPSVVFSVPSLATVGMSEKQARQASVEQGFKLTVNTADATGWMTSRRIGQKHAAYKVILNKDAGTILGAHLLGHNAGEMINILALAIKFGLTRTQLKSLLWAYPTHVSDIKYMI
ncbi:dihydrolipoyl dehydrogenase family protein [Desulfonatronum lacustre]|uniref:dihydrolipoyl dehydrogenase family protein n=1 Tax=Desulfonatronum lacustre TaxID=66849 RepID=UPI00048B7034|nr:NAD(P)/FAD-dependent oxidoreductase [Desulfonatronum lacustre]